MFEANGEPPTCRCGGWIKSATITFGQPIPTEARQAATAAATTCDLFVVIGSSLVVRPAASLPLLAKRASAKIVIINRDPTPLDALADLIIRDDIGTVLDPLAR